MADDNNQIELNLDDPAPKALIEDNADPIVEIVEEGADLKANAEPPKEDDVQDALRKLQDKLKREKKLRERAEREAHDAMQHVSRASNEVANSNLTLVTTAIETVRRDQDILKSGLREAMSIGDFDKAAEIQETLSMNSAKLLQLEQGYNEMRSRPQIEPKPMPRQGSMIDEIAAQVTPTSAKWIKDHRDQLDDPKMIRMMGRAHEDAIDMGIEAETSEYFRFVENRLGINKEESRSQRREAAQEDDSPFSEAAAPSTRRQAPPAAPVSRSGSAPGTRPNVVRLTPAQAEAAKISGLSEVEYYKLMIQERNRTH